MAEPAASGAAPPRAILLMLATMAVFVGTDAMAKHLAHFYPVAEVVWARFCFHLPLVAVVLRGGNLADAVRSRRLELQIARSLLQLISTALFFVALLLLPLATAVSIAFVQPLLVTALSGPLLGERVGGRRWAAVAVGFAGALVIVRPGGGGFGWATALPLGMALSSALYQITTRRVTAFDGPATSMFYTAAFGALATSAAAPIFWKTPDALGWAELAGLGLFAGFGHLLLIQAFARGPASMLAPFTYTQLVWATLLGFLIFGDLPDHWTLGGAAIIVVSGLYVLRGEQMKVRSSPARR
jgi:drug/metabolite transporter (DMT)-like permease